MRHCFLISYTEDICTENELQTPTRRHMHYKNCEPPTPPHPLVWQLSLWGSQAAVMSDAGRSLWRITGNGTPAGPPLLYVTADCRR